MVTSLCHYSHSSVLVRQYRHAKSFRPSKAIVGEPAEKAFLRRGVMVKVWRDHFCK